MIRKSRNDDALARMRAANPFSATELRGAITEAELLARPAAGDHRGQIPSQPIPAGDRAAYERAVRIRPGRSGVFSRHRGASLGLGGLACVAVIAALILLFGGSIRSVRDGATPPSPPPRSRWPKRIRACSSPPPAGRSPTPAASRSTAAN